MIKCNSDICKFINKEKTQCTLEDISLNFSSDYERWGCYCEQFKESDEYRKSTYELKKIDESVFLIRKTDVLEEPDLEMIMQELPCIEEATIYMDRLICCGSSKAYNRLLTAKLNLKEEIFTSTWEIINLYECKYKDVIKKETCDYIRESNNYGVLSSPARKMIKKGINL